MKVWPEAREAVGWTVIAPDAAKSEPSDAAGGPQTTDPVRRATQNRARATRRAKGRVRRFCVANGCAYLWTLTLAEQTADDAKVAQLVESFVRRLRAQRRRAFPYVWVLERHKSGNVHVHLALDGYVPIARLRDAWGHGFVFVTGAKAERSRGKHLGAAGVARYVAKYVGKEVSGGGGRQSYRVAEGFQPREVRQHAWSLLDAFDRAVVEFDGEAPTYTWWSSAEKDDDDRAPPCWWATWNADR